MPIPNRNILIDSKVLQVVEKWSSYSEPELPPTAPDDDDDDYGSSNSDDGREDDKENKDNNDDSQPESDGNDDSNKKEEIANLAAELLDRWKLLRVSEVPCSRAPSVDTSLYYVPCILSIKIANGLEAL